MGEHAAARQTETYVLPIGVVLVVFGALWLILAGLLATVTSLRLRSARASAW